MLIFGMRTDPMLKDNKGYSTMDITISKGFKSFITALTGTDEAATATDSVSNTLLQ